MSNADPARPFKAYVSTALTFLVTFVTIWINDAGSFTAKEAASAAVTALIACGLVGAGTYVTGNPAKP